MIGTTSAAMGGDEGRRCGTGLELALGVVVAIGDDKLDTATIVIFMIWS